MPQIHFYVPKDLASRIRDRADAAGLSVSQYVGALVKTELSSEWPEGFFDNVAGGWRGRRLVRPPQGQPDPRQPLKA